MLTSEDFPVFSILGLTNLTRIGRGATSIVYRGHDADLNRWVAVKILLADDPSDPARRRFQREREITANLGKHPHIVQVLTTGFTSSDFPFVVMELYELGSVADRIRIHGTFSVEDVVDIGAKISDAIDAAHRAGVLHRDIKPANILLSQYGPALADFGIARTAAGLEWSQSLDQLTPIHAGPEVLHGAEPSEQADIYAFGSTLYTMLAGHPPFAGPPGETPFSYQLRIAKEPMVPIARSDVPRQLSAIIERCLEKDPENRFASAHLLRDALCALVGDRQAMGNASHADAPEVPTRRSEIRKRDMWTPSWLEHDQVLDVDGQRVERLLGVSAPPISASVAGQRGPGESQLGPLVESPAEELADEIFEATRNRNGNPGPLPSRTTQRWRPPVTVLSPRSLSERRKSTKLSLFALAVVALAIALPASLLGHSGVPSVTRPARVADASARSTAALQGFVETDGFAGSTPFADPENEAGIAPSGQIHPYTTMAVECYVKGMAVEDGNKDWYLLAEDSPDPGYYVSADTFYNNGRTSGTLRKTPFLDPAVPPCTSAESRYQDASRSATHP